MGEWRRVRIGDFLHRAKSPVSLRDEEEYRLVTVRMHHKGVTLREKKKGTLIGSNMYRVKAGQFILSGIDARHGAFGVIPEELDGAIVTNDFWYFDVDDAVVSRDFFLWFTSTPLFLDACIKSSEGTTNRRRLQAEKFYNFSFNFPGISEQHRLAERFIAFDKAYSAMKDEFETQTTHLKQLRQAMLQEAVEGKLTADWRKQHPLVKGDPQHDATALLAKIKSEKERLANGGKIRKERQLPPIADSDKPFDLPTGWVWCRLGEISNDISDGTHFTPTYTEKGIPFLSVKDISQGHIDFSSCRYISLEEHEQLKKRCCPEFGDVLLTKVGTTGIAKVIDVTNDFSIFVSVALIKMACGLLNSHFMENCINSPLVKKQSAAGTWGVGNKNLVLKTIQVFLIPLPPLAEQQAIVARVDSLMATINALEAQVTERKEQAQLLMQAVLQEAFAGGAADE